MKIIKKQYFAYGSNIDQDRLESRVGKVTKIGTLRINGFRLVFNAGADFGCFANIQMTGCYTDTVEGIVYELSPLQIKKLDKFEGTPDRYTRIILNNKGINMYTYISINPIYRSYTRIPDRNYLQYIRKGCIENKLKRTLKIIEQFPTR